MKTISNPCSLDYAIGCCEKMIDNGNGETLIKIIKQYKQSKSSDFNSIQELNEMLFGF